MKSLIMKVIALLLLAAVSLAVDAAEAPAGALPDVQPVRGDKYNEIVTLTQVLELLHNSYVDKDKASYSTLVQGALKGMLGSLDPYSEYQSPEKLTRFVEGSEGKFVGIGVMMQFRNHQLIIDNPIYDGPAWKAGIRAGDYIVSIDGQEVGKMRGDEAVNKLKGQVGSKVKLGYFSLQQKKVIDVEIMRDNILESPIPYESVKTIDGNIGYIRVSLFSVQLAEELDKALLRLKAHKLDGLIIDLRNNPGGLLVSAVQFCSRFAPTGKMVVRTAGRIKSEDVSYNAQDCEKELSLPVVILINGQSASAAEIVAGCLKDNRRAILVGTRSYGKGSVQKIIRLPDQSGIRYTVALYYTPSSRVIHGQGIEPDIAVPVPQEQLAALTRQLIRSPGEINPTYEGAVADVQLQRAVEILKGINLITAGE